MGPSECVQSVSVSVLLYSPTAGCEVRGGASDRSRATAETAPVMRMASAESEVSGVGP